jgi:hypothetical protein
MLHSSLLGPFVKYKENVCYEYGSKSFFHNNSFSSQLTNWPNKLECNIT